MMINYMRINIEKILIFIALLFLSIYSEISFIAILLIFNLKISKKSFIFFLLIIFFIFFSKKLSIFFPLEILITLILILGGLSLLLRIDQFSEKFIVFLLFTGFVFQYLIVVVSSNNLILKNEWIVDPKLASYSNFLMSPIADNSWINQNLGILGSGRFVYSADIKSIKASSVAFWVQSRDLGTPKEPPICSLKVGITNCRYSFQLNKRESVVSVIGGFWTMGKSSSPILIKNSRLEVLQPPRWFEYFYVVDRVKSFSFNENAFGAWMAVVGLVSCVLTRSVLGFLLVSFLPIAPIFWSGSRSALLAYILAFFCLVLGKFLVPKLKWGRFLLLGYALVCVVLLISGFAFFRNSATETNSSQLTRVITPSYDLSVRGRVQLWRLTTQIWLESPRSFLFGVGNLADALRSNLDARALANGLSKDNITHAHNLWVQTAGETGLLGLLCLCLGWGLAIHRAWKNRDWGALSIFLCVFVINTFDYLFYYAPVQLVFWMAVVGFQKPSDAVESPKALPASA